MYPPASGQPPTPCTTIFVLEKQPSPFHRLPLTPSRGIIVATHNKMPLLFTRFACRVFDVNMNFSPLSHKLAFISKHLRVLVAHRMRQRM